MYISLLKAIEKLKKTLKAIEIKAAKKKITDTKYNAKKINSDNVIEGVIEKFLQKFIFDFGCSNIILACCIIMCVYIMGSLIYKCQYLVQRGKNT